ncbi:hypothetical protein SASPL_140881 [Salvia splendens]|uniref:Uncharacterized protein n=1 Tax=Salvia splendens TaxID=180675 RepID=A0A8X8WR54_SALSN|nr:hypothetical protein SASPL_140881 [Salvia splendens]
MTSKHTPQIIEQVAAYTMRVKVVTRKDELEQLLLQLEKTGGKRPLEDVLGEIQRSRAKPPSAWRPCLDSILETDSGNQ